jgi:predicted Rdx family selenoprotein
VTLIKGGGGIFDVVVEGDLLFSKHRVGRFPDPGEVEKAIRLKVTAPLRGL